MSHTSKNEETSTASRDQGQIEMSRVDRNAPSASSGSRGGHSQSISQSQLYERRSWDEPPRVNEATPINRSSAPARTPAPSKSSTVGKNRPKGNVFCIFISFKHWIF